MPSTKTRVRCPECKRMTAKLARKVGNYYQAYGRVDGSAIYSCGWMDCGVGDFTVHPDGRITNRHRKAVKA